jgi:hypothetical protein
VDDMIDDRTTDHTGGLDLVVCPDCAAPAEVVDRFALPGTEGDVEHVKLMCLARHWFLLPTASLPNPAAPDEPPGRRRWKRTGPAR